MKKIRYFNKFHCGDLHISRGLVRKVMEKVNQIEPETKFSYAHVNDPCLLSDIPNLGYENADLLGLHQFENLNPRLDGISFNTWYGQQDYKYMNNLGMSFDCLYQAFDESCQKLWNFSLSDIDSNPEAFLPIIDYNKFYINEAQKWIEQHPETKIFVSNGHAMSGQATNFEMTSIIVDLAQRDSSKTWILSNIEPQWINRALPGNAIYSHEIIKKPAGSDLNENSFLTTSCDLIIGRASGAFSYAWTQENLIKRKCKFLGFCGPGVMFYHNYNFWNHSFLNGKINYSAQIVASHETEYNKVKVEIEKLL